MERLAKIDNTVNLQPSKCQECNIVKEVLAHQEYRIKNQDKQIKSMETRQKKTDEKKHELFKEKKKLCDENASIKTELRKSNDMLADQLKKVSALKLELDTHESLAEIHDSNQKIKCDSCDFNARNSELLKNHIEIEHTVPLIKEQICPAFSQKFKSNDDLELHMVEEHEDEADCIKCNADFWKESEVFAHSSNCSGLIQINWCEMCEREVISKAVLKKRIMSGKGKMEKALCRNGD